jgi:peptide/nickel transport system substrate-binding protein
MVKNENYFQPANLDGVFIRFVEDDAAQIAALLSGEGDIGTFIAYSDFSQLEAAGVTPILVPSGYNEGWFMNNDPGTAHPAMLDANVRRALALAFNRQEVVDTLLEGRTYLPGTFWEGSAFDNPAIEPLPYDPAQAAALLDEAGWVDSNGNGIRDKDGVELELRYLTTTRQIRVDTQVIAQQDLAEVGVNLILQNAASDIFFSGYAQGGPVSLGQYDIAEWSTTTSFPDPDVAIFLCSEIPSDENPEGSNDTRYCNPEVDALLQEQAQTVDFTARQQLFFRIQELMFEDTVWVGVWYDPDAWAINSRIQNVAISGATPFWNAAEWDLE